MNTHIILLRHLVRVAIISFLSLSLPALAVTEAEFAQMRSQFTDLANRMAALEQENARLRAQSEQVIAQTTVTAREVSAVKQSAAASSWADTIALQGDFRYRFEQIEEEGKDDRDRNRIRARAAIIAQVPNDVELGLGFASGGDDPVSTNQTLGGGGSTKDLRLNLAYFDWNITDKLQFIGGKYKNVRYRPEKNGLIWDGDYNPEGFAVVYKGDHLFANANGSWLESDRKQDNSEFSWGGQAGVQFALGQVRVTAGAGYYDIETKGKNGFFGDDEDFFGNSFTCSDADNPASCVYLFDYKEVELFADLAFKLGDMPVKLFVDYVTNEDADENDEGYALGMKLGSAKAAGSWQATYIYEDLEADATLGLLTDSDFGGGGTDAKGHSFQGVYAINKQWSLSLTYFLNEIGEAEGNQRDYDRVMIDTRFKY